MLRLCCARSRPAVFSPRILLQVSLRYVGTSAPNGGGGEPNAAAEQMRQLKETVQKNVQLGVEAMREQYGGEHAEKVRAEFVLLAYGVLWRGLNEVVCRVAMLTRHRLLALWSFICILALGAS